MMISIQQSLESSLTKIADKIAATLGPINTVTDGRLYTQIILLCVNLRPLYYIRNLPPLKKPWSLGE